MKSLTTLAFCCFVLITSGCGGSDRVVHSASTSPAAGIDGNGSTDSDTDSGNIDQTDPADSTDDSDNDAEGSDSNTDDMVDSGDNDSTDPDGQDADSGSDADNGSTDVDESDGSDNNSEENNTDIELPQIVSGLAATHRNGQTFLTWNEVDAQTQYHVYRSDQPITTANLSSAQLLTGRWGALDPDTSVHKHGTVDVPDNLVIEDNGTPLSDDTGLFVYTTQVDAEGDAYYAVTSVGTGGENTTIETGSNTVTTAVSEAVAPIEPILVSSYNDGKSRLYVHYMDYANWNPTLNGYAYNYFVILPFNFDNTREYPLQVSLHEFGGKAFPISETENQWQVIQLFPSDPGLDENTVHTWWYGYAADHNYHTDGVIPDNGAVRNFTEQRVMQAVSEVIAHADFNVNTDLIHATGNSMGASAALSLGLRYPSVFAGIYASQPMTNYATSPLFQDNFMQLWGEQQDNLPNDIQGPYTDDIQRYSAQGSDPVAIWDWMNHHQQVTERSGDDFAQLIIDIGKADTTIDYQTQGIPLIQALTDGKVPFSAYLADGIDHQWRDYNAVNDNQFGLTTGNADAWKHPNSDGLLALQNATGSGPVVPNVSGDDIYNTNIEWATTQHPFDTPIVDTEKRFEVTLRSTTAVQTVSVTPRNTQLFKPASGTICSWSAERNSDEMTIGSGQTIVDSNALLTVQNMPVAIDTGSRLTVICP
ncbi:MAG: alpha/beta hydrolase-fold protein [Pseudomonadota bacterium]